MDFEHIIIHKDTGFHSAFPETIRLQNGDLVCVFRQAPFREPSTKHGTGNTKLAHHHTDEGSRIAMIRSTDDSQTWDSDKLLIIDTSDGIHDVNMGMISQASNGELIMNNHRWHVNLSDRESEKLSKTHKQIAQGQEKRPFGNIVFDSLYFTKSIDNGITWIEPYPISISGFSFRSHTGKTGLVELSDGTWLMPFHGMAMGDIQDRMFIARSQDRGKTWGQPSTVAYDPEQIIGFHEPPLLRLQSGRLLTVIRTNDADGYLYQAYSDDDGWTWQGLKRSPMWGHPCNLVEMPSGRILCTYGYRRKPFGIRAAFSEDDGLTWDMNHEVIIRDDGIHRDLGYPASVLLNDGRILSTYYFHGEDGVRYIGGSAWNEENAFN